MPTLASFIEGRISSHFETYKEVRLPRSLTHAPFQNVTQADQASSQIHHYFLADPIMHRMN